MASFPNDVPDVEDVIEKADVALYKSKQAGRNQVTHYSASMDDMAA